MAGYHYSELVDLTGAADPAQPEQKRTRTLTGFFSVYDPNNAEHVAAKELPCTWDGHWLHDFGIRHIYRATLGHALFILSTSSKSGGLGWDTAKISSDVGPDGRDSYESLHYLRYTYVLYFCFEFMLCKICAVMFYFILFSFPAFTFNFLFLVYFSSFLCFTLGYSILGYFISFHYILFYSNLFCLSFF
jgi:hypothetical protein